MGRTQKLGGIIAAKPSEVTGRTLTTVSADLSGLTPGKTYSFRVVATDGLGDPTYGQPVTFTTTVDNPPASGSFAVLPLSSVTTGTTLTASFVGWTDQDGNTPLSYEVREGATVIIPAGTSARATFFLPAGTHQVYGRIYDTLGAFTETTAVEIVVGE
jgi:hypothetical protein